MSPLACWSEPILINKINNITKRTKMDQKSLQPSKNDPSHPAPAKINED